MDQIPTSPPGPTPLWMPTFVRLTFLAAFAVAAPLFALADLHPDYFTHYHCDRGDILIVTSVIFFGPPGVLWLLARLCGRRVGRYVAGAATFLLTTTLLGVLLEFGGVPVASWQLPATAAVAAVSLPAILSVGSRRALALVFAMALLVPAHFLNLSTVSVIFFGSVVQRQAPPVMKKPAPVVMLILDELPLPSLMNEQGELDTALFPGFARLAAHATWYRNATTVDPYTFGAVPAMLTGNFAQPFEPPSSSVYPDNLFSLFASQDVEAFEFSTRMLPVSVGTRRRYEGSRLDRLGSIATDVSLILPLLVTGEARNGPKLAEVSQKFQMFTGQKLFFGRLPAPSEYFEEFISHVPQWSPTGLYYFHNLLPHPPWHLLPEGTYYESTATAGYDVTVTQVPRFPGKALQEMTWTHDEYLVQQGYQRHLLQLMYADRQLSRLFDQLEKNGLFDKSLLIVTSDHGAFYGPGAKVRGYTKDSYPFLYCIPLFIKYPGQLAGVVSDANVEHLDLLPTIADVLDVQIPWPVAGRSIIGKSPERPAKHALTALAEPIEMPREVTAKREAAASRRAWFDIAAASPRFPWVYRLKPYGQLMGQPIAGVPVRQAADTTVLLDGSTERPPVWAPPGTGGSLKGCVTSPRLAHGPLWLAVVHKGAIVAVSRVAFPGHETSPFLALFPESIDGRDPGLEVYVIASAPGKPLELERPASVTRGNIAACYTLPRR